MNWTALVFNVTLALLVVTDSMVIRCGLAFVLMFPVAFLIIRVEK